ncbi:MAG TPA: hypothetical protein H9779_04935 [Candidatus Alistipes avicola]|uniref:Lipoprotein n=2 Tax=Alistipes TaxID=239759 RepID=A0A9D2L462_9BACT|nr:hypothetical protein [Candidatus Alistipes avicola]
MKKVLSLMIVVAAAAMVSCAGNQTKKAEAVEAEAVETVETVEAPACCEKADSCAEACTEAAAAETTTPAEATK